MWCGELAWSGVVWCGVVWCGVMWCVVWCGYCVGNDGVEISQTSVCRVVVCDLEVWCGSVV